MKTLQKQLEELYELKRMIESEVFQAYLCQPLREQQDKLRLNFFSDSLKDSWRKGGKFEGIQEFFNLLKIDTDIKNLKDEIEQSE